MTKQSRWISLAVVGVLLIGAFMLAYSSHQEEVHASMTTGEAIITFDEESFDFGNINAVDGQVCHDFEFTNTGKSSLVIDNVKTLCGCLVGEYSKRPIKPGKRGKIRVLFDPKGQEGAFSKTADVESNADNCIVVLSISGNVLR